MLVFVATLLLAFAGWEAMSVKRSPTRGRTGGTQATTYFLLGAALLVELDGPPFLIRLCLIFTARLRYLNDHDWVPFWFELLFCSFIPYLFRLLCLFRAWNLQSAIFYTLLLRYLLLSTPLFVLSVALENYLIIYTRKRY